MAIWSKYAGRRAASGRPSSRVRVYERKDVPDRIFLSRAWVKTASGRPEENPLAAGTTREEAWILCQQTALEREKRILHGRAGPDARAITLGELLERYHASTVVRNWSARHAQNQEQPKRFWLGELGAGAVVERLTTARIERMARAAAENAGWSARTEQRYLAYIRAAVRWGWRKARLYQADPLLGLETPTPRPDTSERVYSIEEMRKLVTPHEGVDWRVTLACSVAYDTGRRISAIRNLKADDMRLLEVEGAADRLALVFRGEHDKGGRLGVVTVSARTAGLLASALEREEVQAHGQLFPGGDVERRSYWSQPIGRDSMISMLHEAEKALGIPWVKHRGYHGIKRLHVTVGMEEGDIDLVRDTTGNLNAEVLRRIYRQRDLQRVTAQVDRLNRRLE